MRCERASAPPRPPPLAADDARRPATRPAQIKDAYRRLCKLHHPDLVPMEQRARAEQYFKELNQAYT